MLESSSANEFDRFRDIRPFQFLAVAKGIANCSQSGTEFHILKVLAHIKRFRINQFLPFGKYNFPQVYAFRIEHVVNLCVPSGDCYAPYPGFSKAGVSMLDFLIALIPEFRYIC